MQPFRKYGAWNNQYMFMNEARVRKFESVKCPYVEPLNLWDDMVSAGQILHIQIPILCRGSFLFISKMASAMCLQQKRHD